MSIRIVAGRNVSCWLIIRQRSSGKRGSLKKTINIPVRAWKIGLLESDAQIAKEAIVMSFSEAVKANSNQS